MRQDISGWPLQWNEDRARQWVAGGQWRNRTVAQALRDLAEREPQRVTQVDGARRLTAGEVWRDAQALASALWAQGWRPGEVLAFQMPNWSEAAAIDVACALIGVVVCPIVSIYRDREVALILEDSGAKGIFIAPEFRGFDHAAMLARLQPGLPRLRQVWTVRGDPASAQDLQGLIAAAPPPPAAWPEVSPDAVKLVLYTSGTTGRPKAVLHSHNSLVRATLMCADHWGIQPGEAVLMPSPVTHVTGFSHGLEMPFYRGIRAVLMEKWAAADAAMLIEREQVVYTVGATPFLQELMDVCEAAGQGLPSLRVFACGGAAVAPEIIHRAARVFSRCRAFRVYGSSEAPMVTLGWNGPGQARLAAETDGQVVDYEVHIVDLDGRRLPQGADGEILVRGPAQCLGYADAGHSAEAFDAEGFFRTGDVGHLTAEGAVVFTGRIKDLINRGGEKISAKEVEDLLHQHPAVAAAAVVAMPHARLGETVCAYVVPRPGQVVDDAALLALLTQAGVARQKFPEKFVFVDDFPKTPSGKVKKDLLREDVRRRLAEEAG